VKDKLVQVSVDRRKHLFTPQHHEAIAKLLQAQYTPQLRYQYPILDQIVQDFAAMLSEDNKDFNRLKFCNDALRSSGSAKQCVVCKARKDVNEKEVCEGCFNAMSAPPLR